MRLYVKIGYVPKSMVVMVAVPGTAKVVKQFPKTLPKCPFTARLIFLSPDISPRIPRMAEEEPVNI